VLSSDFDKGISHLLFLIFSRPKVIHKTVFMVKKSRKPKENKVLVIFYFGMRIAHFKGFRNLSYCTLLPLR
jgi:hypothetical protein